jgi:Zn-dependent protease
MSVVIHEVAHGFMAEYCGDHTARYAGRLTINPLKHLDMFGSIIFPILLFLSTSALKHPFTFGWAKPVPYNPRNLRNEKWGTIAVASAGILANFFIATVFGLLIRFAPTLGLPPSFDGIAALIVVVNLYLGIFNCVPIPPLDGSKILFALLPRSWAHVMYFLEKYSFVFVVIFAFYFAGILTPIVTWAFTLLTGLAF